jgi:hypothetical protein
MSKTTKAQKIVAREYVSFTRGSYQVLAAKIAELEATGKYTKVTSRRPGYGSTFEILCYAEVETTIQERGTCQICGGAFAVSKDGTLANHGYKRPRWGYLVGRCDGRYELPAEKSIELTQDVLTQLAASIVDGDARMVKLLAEQEATPYAERRTYKIVEEQGRQKRVTDPACIDARVSDLANLLWHWKGHVKMLNEFVLPRFGMPLYEKAR